MLSDSTFNFSNTCNYLYVVGIHFTFPRNCFFLLKPKQICYHDNHEYYLSGNVMEVELSNLYVILTNILT